MYFHLIQAQLSPLHWASLCNSVSVLKCLRFYHADIYYEARYGDNGQVCCIYCLKTCNHVFLTRLKQLYLLLILMKWRKHCLVVGLPLRYIIVNCCSTSWTSFVQEVEEEFLQEKLPELLEVATVWRYCLFCIKTHYCLFCSPLILLKLIVLGASTVYVQRWDLLQVPWLQCQSLLR